jgi:hypothetical protein
MAYIGRKLYLVTWTDGILRDSLVSQTSVVLLGEPVEQGEQESLGVKATQGFII